MTPTDIAAAVSPSATPLAALVAHSPLARDLAAYRGVFTPHELDVPAREIEALVSGRAVHDLGWMRRVAVRGEDRFRWLSGMVTNTVSDLAPNTGAWNLVLNAQGRIQGDVWVWRDGDALELEIAADQYDKLLAHLNHFIIMDDVELVALEEETALGLTGPHSGEILTRLGLPALDEPLMQARADWTGFNLVIRRSYGVLAPHYELWAPHAALKQLWEAFLEAGATPVGVAALEMLRIAEGIPAYGIDIVERDLPQETAQSRALHFNKGCYLGQEIVERIRSRGNVHRHLRPLELTGPLPPAGTELFIEPASGASAAAAADSKAAGHITSAAELPLPSGKRVFALGMIRAEAESSNSTFTYAAGSAAGTARISAAPSALNP
ncbi:MAG: folate-binding protein [Terracidiphilus sp.]